VKVDGIEFKQPQTYLFYLKKWKENEDNTVTRRLNESPLCYDMGNIDREIRFRGFGDSVIESSYLFPRGVRNEMKIENKRWLIVGGTGSLGKKVMDIYGSNNTIYVMSRDENKHWELKDKYKNTKFILGDIRDYEKVNEAINLVNPNIIVMAAALKHIDTCEYEVRESLETNTVGTMNVLKSVRLSKLKGLETVLFVSTDKACYPINTYGMCKALSEKAMVEESLKMCDGYVKYINIRYGNVLNSRGSIIPKLREWKGDTYYLTHPEMTRFLMTQEDSVELMTYAIMNGESGDTIVPKIDAMSIKDLFEIYNERSGGGKRIEITKLRPGE
jgi:UDP-glucose 4-epimerase